VRRSLRLSPVGKAPAPELSEVMISKGMARPEKVACQPGDGRCSPFPDSLESARTGCSAQKAPEGALQARLDHG
jgi:hypothetical protein